MEDAERLGEREIEAFQSAIDIAEETIAQLVGEEAQAREAAMRDNRADVAAQIRTLATAIDESLVNLAAHAETLKALLSQLQHFGGQTPRNTSSYPSRAAIAADLRRWLKIDPAAPRYGCTGVGQQLESLVAPHLGAGVAPFVVEEAQPEQLDSGQSEDTHPKKQTGPGLLASCAWGGDAMAQRCVKDLEVLFDKKDGN